MNEAAYLETLQKIINDPDAMCLPRTAPIIACWLKTTRPVDHKEATHGLTSTEIVAILDDIAKLRTIDVAATMVAAGYELFVDRSGELMWAMSEPIDDLDDMDIQH